MAGTTGEIAFTVIWIVSITPIGIYWLCKFYRNRHKYPLKGRYPSLSMMAGIAVLSIAIYYPLITVTTENGTWSCAPDDIIIMSFVVTFALTSYVLRIWILFFQFRLIPQQLAVASKFPWQQPVAHVENTADRKWFVDHQYMIGPRFLIGSTVFYFVWRIILYVPNAIACEEVVPQDVANFSSVILLCFCMGLIVGIVRHTEGRFIKTEFKMMAVIGTVHIIMFVAGSDAYVTKHFTVNTLFSPLLQPFYFAAAIMFPIWRVQTTAASVRAITVQLIPQRNDREPSMSLNRLLEFDEGKQSFTNYLEKELSVENILFWGAIQKFKTRYSPLEGSVLSPRKTRRCINDAIHIFDSFVAEEAKLQVNLSSENSRNLETKIDKLREVQLQKQFKRINTDTSIIDVDFDEDMHDEDIGDEDEVKEEVIVDFEVDGSIYDDAFEEILRLMEDPFFRYMISPLYTDLTEDHPEVLPKKNILKQQESQSTKGNSETTGSSSLYVV